MGRFLSFLIFLLLIGPAWGQEAPDGDGLGIDLRVSCLGQSQIVTRGGEWVPIRVAARNPGAEDLEGTVTCERVEPLARGGFGPVDRLRYSGSLSLPPGGRRALVLPVFVPQNFGRIRVRFAPRDRDPIDRILTIQSRETAQVLVCGETSRVAGALGAAGFRHPAEPRQRVVPIQPDRLPDRWIGYDSVDHLVLYGLDFNRLSDRQIEAILGWVRSGGHLVVIFSGETNGFRKTFLAPLLPMEITEVTERRELRLGGGRPARFEKPVLFALGREREAAVVLARAGSAPALLRSRVGVGSLTFYAYDAGGGFAPGTYRRHVIRLLVPPRARLHAFSGGENRSAVDTMGTNRVGRAEAVRPPSRGLILGLLLAYVLLVGPGLYFGFKWRNKLPYALLAAPVVALLTAFALYVVGTLGRGSGPVEVRFDILEGRATEPVVRLTSHHRLQAQTRRYLEIAGDEHRVTHLWPRGESEGTLVWTQTGALERVQVEKWSTRLLTSVRMHKGSAAPFEADLRIESAGERPRLTGRIRPQLGLPLDAAVLLFGTREYTIGPKLQDGEAREVDRYGRPIVGENGFTFLERLRNDLGIGDQTARKLWKTLRVPLLRWQLEGRALIVAWSPKVLADPLPVDPAARFAQGWTLILVQVPVGLGERFSVQALPTLVGGKLSTYTDRGPRGPTYSSERKRVNLEFQLPRFPEYEVREMALRLDPAWDEAFAGGITRFRVEVYDPGRDRMIEMPLSDPEFSGKKRRRVPTGRVDPGTRVVRFRFSNPGGAFEFGLPELTVGMEK